VPAASVPALNVLLVVDPLALSVSLPLPAV